MSTSIESILRATAILVVAWCSKQTFTPPNPPPKDGEQKKYYKDNKSSDTYALPAKLMSDILPIGLYVLYAIELLDTLSSGSLSDFILPATNNQSDASLYIASPERIFGVLLIVAGTAVRLACYRRMAKNFTFELAVRDGHKLVTDGPYAVVRHPAYTGGVSVIIGCLLLTLGRGSWWAERGVHTIGWSIMGIMQILFSMVFVSGVFPRCMVEDATMREHFKDDWVRWAHKTPYRMLPFLF